MPRKPKPLEPLDLEVISILVEHQDAAEVSQRSLARDTGMSLNRVGIIVRAEGPAPTVGELALLANALGLRASAVVREAEVRLRDRSLDGRTVPGPRQAAAGRGAVPDASTRAARTVRDRPEHGAARQWDDVGEESQLPPKDE